MRIRYMALAEVGIALIMGLTAPLAWIGLLGMWSWGLFFKVRDKF